MASAYDTPHWSKTASRVALVKILEGNAKNLA